MNCLSFPNRVSLSACVVDIGSPKKGKLGWAYCTANGSIKIGRDLDEIIDWISSKLSSEAIALGFEAPMYIPARECVTTLTDARPGEGSKPWSAGAGCGALTTALAITTYTLRRLRRSVRQARAFLNWRTFEAKPGHILLFEAFVSGKDKGDTDMIDAAIALKQLVSHSILQEIESALLDDGPVTSLLGAALLSTGWPNDVGVLNERCLVVRPATAIPI